MLLRVLVAAALACGTQEAHAQLQSPCSDAQCPRSPLAGVLEREQPPPSIDGVQELLKNFRIRELLKRSDRQSVSPNSGPEEASLGFVAAGITGILGIIVPSLGSVTGPPPPSAPPPSAAPSSAPPPS